MACSFAPSPSATYDTIGLFRNVVGNKDFVVAGVGTRDVDVGNTPVSITITIPGSVGSAYLYWNILVQNSFSNNTAIFEGNTVTGSFIGWTGDTCWYALDPGPPHPDGATTEQNIRNRVYRANVTPFVTGSGSYSVTIPGIVLNPDIATGGSDTPHYPGCSGSQGVALFVIYNTPGPKKSIFLYDGAKLILPNALVPAFGGTPTHTITFSTNYTANAKIALVAGDAQTDYEDAVLWNGNPLPVNVDDSYFNPTDVDNVPIGNLLSCKTHTGVTGFSTNVVTASSEEDECVCWFLFAYAGECPTATCVGDPHFVGVNGERFDFHGKTDRFFALWSDENLQINSFFRKFRKNETFMELIGAKINTADGEVNLKMDNKGESTVNDVKLKFDQTYYFKELSGNYASINYTKDFIDYEDPMKTDMAGLFTDRFVTIETSDYLIKIVRSTAFKKNILNLIVEMKNKDLMAHGVLGQTTLKREKMVEGNYGDYEVTGLFDHNFKYSKFKSDAKIADKVLVSGKQCSLNLKHL